MTQLDADALQSRKETITSRWYDGLAPSIAEHDAAEVKAQLAEWTEVILTLLLSEPLKREIARAVGEALVRDISPKPAILGKTQEVLAQQIVADLPAEQVAVLLPRLTEVLAEVATGFAQEKDRLVQTMRRKFLSTTSHDMRSPLNAIIGFSRIIMKGVDGPVTDLQSQDLETIYTSGQSLLKMIDDVFNIEKIEAGSVEIDAKTFELQDLVGSIVSDVQPLIDEYGNTLDVQYADAPDEIHSDPGKIKQILVNLLARATKFTRQGTVALNVALAAAEGADWIRFQISNTGLGMTPQQIERFTHAKSSGSPQYDDIGLMVSQRLCQLLGGEIVIESEAGQGVTFTIDLPVRHPSA
ncbi:MAG: HAMP domain-containing histidine kinase [Anaerolineae bacterium]|nr:HAMP domain-containing histidine kinase [Anaerolineae bacterium]